MWRAKQIAELRAEIAALTDENLALREANTALAAQMHRARVLDIAIEGRSLKLTFTRGLNSTDRAELTTYAPMGFKIGEWRKWLIGN